MSTLLWRGINVAALADLGLQWKDIEDNAVHGLADVRGGYYQSKALDNCFQLLSRQTLKEKKIASFVTIWNNPTLCK